MYLYERHFYFRGDTFHLACRFLVNALILSIFTVHTFSCILHFRSEGVCTSRVCFTDSIPPAFTHYIELLALIFPSFLPNCFLFLSFIHLKPLTGSSTMNFHSSFLLFPHFMLYYTLTITVFSFHLVIFCIFHPAYHDI